MEIQVNLKTVIIFRKMLEKCGNAQSIRIIFLVESFDALDENTGRSTPRLSPPKKESTGGPYRSTRFGFRLNRPASTGISVSKNVSSENVINNNHSESKINGKHAMETN